MIYVGRKESESLTITGTCVVTVIEVEPGGGVILGIETVNGQGETTGGVLDYMSHARAKNGCNDAWKKWERN